MDERIQKVMAAVFGVPAESIKTDATPQSVENWDSLRHMSLVLSLEEEFEVEFDENQISEMNSFAAIRSQLEALQP